MNVKQVSVFLENRTGRMAEATRLMGNHKINIRALSIADTTNFGILRLIVNDYTKAEQVFKEAGYTVSLTDVIALEIPDSPGGLADILEKLQKACLDIEYLYAFVEKNADKAVVIFRFDDAGSAMKKIESAGIKAIPAEEVYAL